MFDTELALKKSDAGLVYLKKLEDVSRDISPEDYDKLFLLAEASASLFEEALAKLNLVTETVPS